MDLLKRGYNVLFYDRADPRVKDWLFMTTPVTPAAILAVYLIVVKIILPVYMRHRKPYDLRRIIKWYNVLQIVSCSVISWGLLTSGWTTHYKWVCELPDYSMDPMATRMLRFMWWTMVLKLIELVETAFFVLRKKDNQASFLHVYHHVSTLIVIWAAVKYTGGGMTSFAPLLNSLVHIIMYTYYLLSSEGGPKLKAFLNKYKKWLTIMQMVQFTVMVVYTLLAYLPSCTAPKGITYLFLPNVAVVYFMFYDFYKASYLKNDNKVINGAKSK